MAANAASDQTIRRLYDAQRPKQSQTRSTGSSIASTVSAFTTPIKNAITSQAARRTLVSSVILGILVAISIAASVFAYIIFYYIYIPQIGFTKQVWLQYGYGRPPFAHIDLLDSTFASDQIYDVVLELVVPTSRRNIDLGNFMVDLDLRAADGTSIIKASRPTSLTYIPDTVRSIKTFARLPALILSSKPSLNEHLVIPLITRQVLRTFSTSSIQQAVVSVGRQDSQTTTESCRMLGELQVYSATLNVRAHLQGFRAFMYNHRITSFFIFSTVFFISTLLSALTFWGLMSLRSAFRGKPQSATIDDKDSSSGRSAPSESTYFTTETKSLGGHFVDEDVERDYEEEAARRLEKIRREQARRKAEREGSVLQHLKLGSSASQSEDEGIVVKKEEDDLTSSGSSIWQDLQDSEDSTVGIKQEDDDLDIDDATIGGSMTSIGDTGSRFSFGPSITTATSASMDSQSLRQRPSSRSLRSLRELKDRD